MWSDIVWFYLWLYKYFFDLFLITLCFWSDLAELRDYYLLEWEFCEDYSALIEDWSEYNCGEESDEADDELPPFI